MADYDSDSSDGGTDVSTNVLLGYASNEPTGDEFSQLGGQPTWLSPHSAPSAAFAKCKVCNGACSLLLQLNADLAQRFPGHERRMYVFGCRKKICRRKEGSVRAVRGVRVSGKEGAGQADTVAGQKQNVAAQADAPPGQNLGETLFGGKSPTPGQSNPFAAPTRVNGQGVNPFATTKPAASDNSTLTKNQSSAIADLSQTFADKARVSSPPAEPAARIPDDPWQEDPSPYPFYHLDADKEYLEAEPDATPSNARVDNSSEGGEGGKDDKTAFESSMDKTFQRFADRLSQNPEQVLRYEFSGQPLLYSKDDKVGKLLAPAESNSAKVQTVGSASGGKMPHCGNCGAARVFEMQLAPHAITELEAEDMGIDGMDWGTIIVGSCAQDCQQRSKAAGEVGYVEEWVGVQWEEVADGRKT